MKFRKKPVIIEAICFDSNSSVARMQEEWGVSFGYSEETGGSKDIIELYIQTLEGLMTARFGDWIIKGVAGEFYPCKPEIFERTYILASGTTSDQVAGLYKGFTKGDMLYESDWELIARIWDLIPELLKECGHA